jgi:diguanylate cyclase (GGDEF)-like protein/PAS domain S-box-containing protein
MSIFSLIYIFVTSDASQENLLFVMVIVVWPTIMYFMMRAKYRTNNDLVQNKAFLEKILNESIESTIIVEANSLQILECSQSTLDGLGEKNKQMVIGKDLSYINEVYYQGELSKSMSTIISKSKHGVHEISFNKDGEKIYYQISTKEFEVSDILYFIITVKDITDAKKKNKKIKSLAYSDELTGIYNRRRGMMELDNAIENASNNGTNFSILIMDVDHFKNINDNYGHQTGDELLIIGSQRLQNIISKDDVLARIGGDEFMIIIKKHNDRNNIFGIAERIRDKCNEPLYINNNSFSFNLSIGIATYPEDGTTSKELISSADNALYESKNNGRNLVSLTNRR